MRDGWGQFIFQIKTSGILICSQDQSDLKIKSPGEEMATSYVNIKRTWHHGITEPQFEKASFEDDTPAAMLQRWQQESLGEQPYHAIGAVSSSRGDHRKI
jgi:hypothetical protein